MTREPERNPVELVLQQDRPMGLNADTVLIRKDGSEAAIEDSASPIHDWSKRIAGAVIVFHDVSEARSMTEKMAHLAQHDFLTNLPNRILLNDRIAQAINLAKRHGTQLAVLFLDLDNFKNVNDSLGHEIGDKLLQSVAERLHACVRSSDTVSRQGGDEFVLLLPRASDAEAANAAQRIRDDFKKAGPAVLGSACGVSMSVGIASLKRCLPSGADQLIACADAALYRAKDAGRDRIETAQSLPDIKAPPPAASPLQPPPAPAKPEAA